MKLSRPRVEDAAVLDVTLNLFAYPAMLVAHRLGLFRQLAQGPRSLQALIETMQLARRPLEALLNTAAALGFVARANGVFSLTTLAEDYLLDTGPAYFGYFWDLMLDNGDTYAAPQLERAVRNNSSQAYGEQDIFRSHEQQLEQGRRFTRAMHSLSMGHASAWPRLIDLSNHRVFLDVGGGSGAHAIGAVSAWETLRAVIYDLPAICEMSGEFVVPYGLGARITSHAGDMWMDPFPSADLHFYSNIFHDWTPEKCKFLAAKSFDALPSGGRIVLHEVLYDDDKTGPFAAAAFSVVMLGWTEGEQYSGLELRSLLEQVGFRQTQVIPSAGHYSLVTGIKP
ncbi:methyltransferase [Dyella tabacisoli]|uniref:Methyltransferase n=1 Tax=Dyella tabacisoli TaxID=2282381 RepID=A0A369UI81_9GAMM|nr:methyltransferase [Dyella tabacisoli]RDD80207.1 methyltransferase [Dyella tabacisoli]